MVSSAWKPIPRIELQVGNAAEVNQQISVHLIVLAPCTAILRWSASNRPSQRDVNQICDTN